MPDTTLPKSGTAVMRPRARLIGLIGDELISDKPVAVVELVKNAYDADATKVTVKFEVKAHGLTRSLSPMTAAEWDLPTVLNAWFEPGTISKRKQERSPEKGRLYQGAKGIGRFASARLAEALFLESKPKGAQDAVVVLLEWGTFDEDSYLDEIRVQYEVRPLPDMQSGTRLTMQGIRKDWTAENYEELHNRLSRLISPFNEISDFQIVLELASNADVSGPCRTPRPGTPTPVSPQRTLGRPWRLHW